MSATSKLLPRHIQSVWDQLPTAQQAEMLSFDLRLLYARANYVEGQCHLIFLAAAANHHT